MIAALVLLFGYVVLVWLVFFKFKWLKFTIAWGVVSVFFGLHLLIIFMIGLRFVTPYSTEAKIIQHTIQLIPPRLLDERRRDRRGSAHGRSRAGSHVPVVEREPTSMRRSPPSTRKTSTPRTCGYCSIMGASWGARAIPGTRLHRG
jgi:hypothetical protein